MNKLDIKRQLGVGVATLADHLREYKDPFEPSDTAPDGAVRDFDFQLSVLLTRHGDGDARSDGDDSPIFAPSKIA